VPRVFAAIPFRRRVGAAAASGVSAVRAAVPCGAGLVYTWRMTTSISVPDPIFQEAEQLAERLEKTRNQLYTEALIEYLARRNPDTITERLNAVYDSVAEPEDRFVTETAQDVLRRVEW